MRVLGRFLKAAAALSLVLATFAIAGGLDWLAGQEKSVAVQPEQEARADPAPAEPTMRSSVTGAKASPSDWAPSDNTSHSEEMAKSDTPPATDDAKSEPVPAAQTAVAGPADLGRQEIVRLAVAIPQIPAPGLAHIPGLVLKFAPAKVLFGAVAAPANMASRSIGFYAKGCLAGAKPLPVNGPAWQAMRLSRNRMWGHPSLVRYIERFAKDAKEKDGWPGLLVGDMSLPRGGPMPFGHASHQVGLDVDIWYKPMPDRKLTDEEREKMPMESFLLDPGHVNPAVWTPEYTKLLRRAVSYPEVSRIFVNPAIKKWLCDNVKENRAFMRKIHPIMGHDDHFHVRLVCPADNPGCRNQPDKAVDEGCGKSLDAWIAKLSKEQPSTLAVASGPKPIPLRASRANRLVTVERLPPDCRKVLQAPSVTAAK